MNDLTLLHLIAFVACFLLGMTLPTAGLTVQDVARRLRVSPDKVRAWIKKGELVGCNTASALCGRPRFVVQTEELDRFMRRRTTAPPPKPTKRRRKRSGFVDYYPDMEG